nr:permease prefix domain 1-containing protein [Deinobacterium chartae]
MPRHERLEAAAELRAHLEERAAQLTRMGFSREEAEHVVLRRMGEAAVINGGLLRAVLERPLGWLALAGLVLILTGTWLQSFASARHSTLEQLGHFQTRTLQLSASGGREALTYAGRSYLEGPLPLSGTVRTTFGRLDQLRPCGAQLALHRRLTGRDLEDARTVCLPLEAAELRPLPASGLPEGRWLPLWWAAVPGSEQAVVYQIYLGAGEAPAPPSYRLEGGRLLPAARSSQ